MTTRDRVPSVSHSLVTSNAYPAPFARNEGLVSLAEQRRLGSAVVLVAGVGGVGGRVAETLARSGVGEIRLADPDTFAESNLNRQAACTTLTIGRNKAEVVAELCRSINPECGVVVEPAGVTAANVDSLLEGADVVVDGTDYSLPAVGLLLARAARATSVPVVLAVEVGFGAWVTTMTPRGATLETLLGLPEAVDLERVADGSTPVSLWRWIGRLPPYVDLGNLRRVESGELAAPAVAPAVELSASLVSSSVLSVLLGRRPPAVAPRVWHVDVRTGKSRKYVPRRGPFAVSVARALAASGLARYRGV